MEATVLPDDYLTAADEMVSQAHTFPPDSDPAAASGLEAQVKAIQAVAAAIDRLPRPCTVLGERFLMVTQSEAGEGSQ